MGAGKGERSATRRFWRWWGCEGEACFPFGGGHLVVVRWLLSQRMVSPFRGGWSCMGAWCSKGFLWIPLVVPLRRGRWPLQGVSFEGDSLVWWCFGGVCTCGEARSAPNPYPPSRRRYLTGRGHQAHQGPPRDSLNPAHHEQALRKALGPTRNKHPAEHQASQEPQRHTLEHQEPLGPKDTLTLYGTHHMGTPSTSGKQWDPRKDNSTHLPRLR